MSEKNTGRAGGESEREDHVRTAMRAAADALHDLLVEIRRIAERGGQ